MWSLNTPILELIIRASTVYVMLLVLFRISGKKNLGELAPFDFILLLIISEATQNALVKQDDSLLSSFILVATLMLIDAILSKITFHFKKAEEIIEGQPVCLVKNGVINHEALEKEKVSIQELEQGLREQGVLDASEVYLANLETNGKISVIKKKDAKLMSKFRMWTKS